jgi:hypothetical protein
MSIAALTVTCAPALACSLTLLGGTWKENTLCYRVLVQAKASCVVKNCREQQSTVKTKPPRSKMKARCFAILLIQMLCFSLRNPAQADETRYSPQELTTDFDILRSALTSGDPGVYRYTSSTALDAAFKIARARLDQPMYAADFYRVLAPMIAEIKNGHTQLQLPKGLREKTLATEPILPLGVRVLGDDRVYVLRDFRSGHHDLAGFELLSVNGYTAKWITSKMRNSLSEDGDIPTSRRRDSSGLAFVENLALLLDIRSPFSIEVKKGRHRTSVKVSGILKSDLILSWKQLYPDDDGFRKPPSADFRLLRGGAVAVMRLSHWDDPDEHPENDLRKKFAEWFSTLEANKTKTLIIDIRRNGGGEETLGTLLFSYLAKEPFLYYKAALANGPDFDFFRYAEGHEERDALPRYVAPLKTPLKESLPGKPTAQYELVNRPNLGVQQPRKPHFDGQVLILINGGSFSTSAEFAAICHSHQRATFIGEESSGAYYGDDSGITPTLVLPNTKLRIDVPLIAYYTAVNGVRHQNRGVLPDCPVRYTIQDELEGRDKEMAIALKLAAGEKLTSCKRIDY